MEPCFMACDTPIPTTLVSGAQTWELSSLISKSSTNDSHVENHWSNYYLSRDPPDYSGTLHQLPGSGWVGGLSLCTFTS